MQLQLRVRGPPEITREPSKFAAENEKIHLDQSCALLVRLYLRNSRLDRLRLWLRSKKMRGKMCFPALYASGTVCSSGLALWLWSKRARQNEPSSSACFWDGLQLGAFVMVAVKKESRQDVPSSSICFRNGLQLGACQIVVAKWTELCAWRIAGKDR